VTRFDSYQTNMRVGRRDAARTDLVRADIAGAAQVGEYRRLLYHLDTALLTAGKVELKRRGKPLIVACAAPKIVLGRDALCDLPLRAGGVSRQHAEIDRGDGFHLRDLDSRNGTTIGGLPLVGRVPLADAGRFGLGDECSIDFEAKDGILILRIANGSRSGRLARRRRRRRQARARDRRDRARDRVPPRANRCSAAATCAM